MIDDQRPDLYTFAVRWPRQCSIVRRVAGFGDREQQPPFLRLAMDRGYERVKQMVLVCSCWRLRARSLQVGGGHRPADPCLLSILVRNAKGIEAVEFAVLETGGYLSCLDDIERGFGLRMGVKKGAHFLRVWLAGGWVWRRGQQILVKRLGSTER